MRLELEKKQNRTENQSFSSQNNWSHPSTTNCLQTMGLDNLTHYSNIYRNSNGSSQENCGIGMSQVDASNQLDLHYAYRDDYSAHSMQPPNVGQVPAISMHKLYEQDPSSTAAVHCTYTGFNCHETYSDYSQHQHSSTYAQSHHEPTTNNSPLIASTNVNCSTTFPSYRNDERTEQIIDGAMTNEKSTTEPTENQTIHSNSIQAPAVNNEKQLVNLLSPPADSSEIHAINDLLENNRNTVTATETTILPDTQNHMLYDGACNIIEKNSKNNDKTETNSKKMPECISSSLINNGVKTAIDQNGTKESLNMSEEHLSEVIKQSIVETSSV